MYIINTQQLDTNYIYIIRLFWYYMYINIMSSPLQLHPAPAPFPTASTPASAASPPWASLPDARSGGRAQPGRAEANEESWPDFSWENVGKRWERKKTCCNFTSFFLLPYHGDTMANGRSNRHIMGYHGIQRKIDFHGKIEPAQPWVFLPPSNISLRGGSPNCPSSKYRNI